MGHAGGLSTSAKMLYLIILLVMGCFVLSEGHIRPASS